MKEYFIFSQSFAAPFVSDSGTHFQKGSSPKDALERFAKAYKHPCGLYSAGCYESAESFHKNGKLLARWLSNHAKTIEDAKPTMIRSDGHGVIEIDNKSVRVKDPKAGQVVA